MESPDTAKQQNLYAFPRPGRSKGSKSQVNDALVTKWALYLPGIPGNNHLSCSYPQH